jgi:potassium inwardly-rectifying channel subfamily J
MFEVVIILEGTVESSGQPTQARTSYLPHEILRGHYFQDLSEFSVKSADTGERVIDFSLFHNTFCPSDYVVKY